MPDLGAVLALVGAAASVGVFMRAVRLGERLTAGMAAIAFVIFAAAEVLFFLGEL
jgi:hypothetical protein